MLDPVVLDEMVKASKTGAKALDFNPQDLDLQGAGVAAYQSDAHGGSYTGLSYSSLASLARMPLISAIIQTRINQIAEFGRPAPDRHSAGFVIRVKDQRDAPSDEQQEKIAALQRWLMSCGDPRVVGTTTFEQFLRMLTRDSLTYDQACFEVIYARGRPSAFKVVDASSMRLAAPSSEELKAGRRDPKKAAYVQVIDNKIRAEFNRQEMGWGIRRPRSSLRGRGYGFPELEELYPTIVDLAHAKAYNSANFTHGLHLSGILAVKSKMSPALFRAFRREFYSMLQGPNGAKKTPIIQLDPENKEEVSSVSLSNSNRDMEFSNWLNFLIKEAASIYQMDPAELGFVYGNEGQSGGLNQAGPGQRIHASKERGLRPLLRAIESWINRWIISPLDDELELVFVGLDAETETQRIEALNKKVRAFMTINEARAEMDLEALDNPAADMLLDSSYMMQAAQGGEGEEGELPGGDFEQETPDIDQEF